MKSANGVVACVFIFYFLSFQACLNLLLGSLEGILITFPFDLLQRMSLNLPIPPKKNQKNHCTTRLVTLGFGLTFHYQFSLYSDRFDSISNDADGIENNKYNIDADVWTIKVKKAV